ncbi:MAG: LLM class flavin-dependent oxidoreductase [Acidimicrobiales bacterium]
MDQNESRTRSTRACRCSSAARHRPLHVPGRALRPAGRAPAPAARARPHAQPVVPGGSPDSVAVIAKNDVNPLVIPTTSLDLSLEVARTYTQLRAEAGHRGGVNTKLALWTYVAETEEDARAGAEQFMVEYADSALRHYEMRGTHLKDLKGYERYGALSDMLRQDASPFLNGFFNSHPWGTPDQTIARATELAEAFGTNEIMFIFKYGSMPIDKALASMRLFAKEVMPALKELNPLPLEPAMA